MMTLSSPCVCFFGIGKNCSVDTNECDSSPCKNGGECVDLVNNYRCICTVGFVGKSCEVDHDHCNPNPCKNDAPCLVNAQEDEYFCHCPPGWQGKNCSTPAAIIDCESKSSFLPSKIENKSMLYILKLIIDSDRFGEILQKWQNSKRKNKHN
jgi:EGF-like domain